MAKKKIAADPAAQAADRWETAISIIAMAIGGGLIGSGEPSKSIGWAIVVLAGTWQVGKTLWVTVVDYVSKKK